MRIFGVIPSIELQVVPQLDKGDYPENSPVVFCPNKQRSFEPFMCLDIVLERLQSFLFQILFKPDERMNCVSVSLPPLPGSLGKTPGQH